MIMLKEWSVGMFWRNSFDNTTKNIYQIFVHKTENVIIYSYLCICIAKKEACDIDLTTLSPIPLLF